MGRITVSPVGLEWLVSSKTETDQVTKASDAQTIVYEQPTNRRAIASSPELLKTSFSVLPSLKDNQAPLVTSPNESILERSQAWSFSTRMLGSVRSEQKTTSSNSAAKVISSRVRSLQALEESSQKFVILKKKLELKAQIKFVAPEDPGFFAKFQVAPLPESLAKIRRRAKGGKPSIHVLRQSAANPYREHHRRIPGSLTSLNPTKARSTRAECPLDLNSQIGLSPKPPVTAGLSQGPLFRISDFKTSIVAGSHQKGFATAAKALTIHEPSMARST